MTSDAVCAVPPTLVRLSMMLATFRDRSGQLITTDDGVGFPFEIY